MIGKFFTGVVQIIGCIAVGLIMFAAFCFYVVGHLENAPTSVAQAPAIPQQQDTKGVTVTVGPSNAASVAAPCSVSDIKIDKLRDRQDGEYIYITGRLINNCSRAIGPEVKITLYDSEENILAVNDMWPASLNNVPANSEFPFQDVERVEGFDKVTAQVIGLRAWADDSKQ